METNLLIGVVGMIMLFGLVAFPAITLWLPSILVG
jgi:hypothetical protein